MAGTVDSLRKILGEDFSYFKDWYDFYFNVEKYLPEESMARIFEVYPENVFRLLSQFPSAKTTLRKAVLGMFGLTESVAYDVGAKSVRLAVTEKEVLSQASVVAGAIFFHGEIAKIVGKRELAPLVEFIGQDTYSFLIKRGLMLWKMVPALKFDGTGTIVERIEAVGAVILCHALHGLPEGMHRRLELVHGKKFDIPKSCDSTAAKKCFDLIQFSIEKIGGKCYN